MKHFQNVKEFHEKFNSFINDKTQLPDSSKLRNLRINLLQEEFNEYLEAEKNDDLIEIADALGDMLYIIYGTALTYGIPLDDIVNEIHRSNMSKLGKDGKPIYREDGKILKGENYFKPDIKTILNNHVIVKRK